MEQFMFPLYKITTPSQNEINAGEPITNFTENDAAYVVTESVISFGTVGATDNVFITLADPTGEYDRVGFTVTWNFFGSGSFNLAIVTPNAAAPGVPAQTTMTAAGDSVTVMWNGTFWQTVAQNTQ